MAYSYSQHTLFWLVIIFSIITLLSGPIWKYWFIIPFSLFNWLLIDLMFFTENMFMFEPNLFFWQEANTVEY
jgi:hypothetical protein